jgi:PhzF family phenazine biosynthesis protein
VERDFRQVDVFGEVPFSGNPVAVVLDAEGLTDDELRQISVWSNLSECTFVLPPTDPSADFRVRIFSLHTEYPFAGHPTLGTARAWLDAGGQPATAGTLVQECAAGLVPVRLDGDRLAFRTPPRLRSGPVDPETRAAIIDILGIDSARVLDAEWLDNGPGWVGVLLDSVETVRALQPDASQHPGRWDIGVMARQDSRSSTAFEVRAFFTEGGEPLREDPVTGSLNGAAAEWLISTDRAPRQYVALQGTAMGRRGRVHIESVDDDVWVGGRTDVVIRGTMHTA